MPHQQQLSDAEEAELAAATAQDTAPPEESELKKKPKSRPSALAPQNDSLPPQSNAKKDKNQKMVWLDGEVQKMVQGLPFEVDENDMVRAASRFKVFFAGVPADSEVWRCSVDSIRLCVAKSALTGLFPGGHAPEVDLIPRSGRLEWQPGFHGYIVLCRRNPGWDLDAIPVWNDDEFDEGYTTERGQYFDLKPSGYDATGIPSQDKEALRGVLVVVTHRDPSCPDVVIRTHKLVSKGDILARRAVAQTKKVWDKWFVEMALKTALRYVGQRGTYFPLDDSARRALAFAAESDRQIEATLRERPAAAGLLEAGDE